MLRRRGSTICGVRGEGSGAPVPVYGFGVGESVDGAAGSGDVIDHVAGPAGIVVSSLGRDNGFGDGLGLWGFSRVSISNIG